MIAAATALLIANSALGPAYFHGLHTTIGGLDVLHWVNDGLMAVFFLFVGLELKREVLNGELSTWSKRALPGIAAAGGMIVPAVLYVVINWAPPPTLRGWAVPAATDIAFALAVLALLGSRIPASLKLFLTALAIMDDLGAIVIIAAFYTSDLDLAALAGAGGCIAVLVVLNRLKVGRLWPYLLAGVLLWLAVHRSGVHATLAGVILAFAIPATPARSDRQDAAPLVRLEHALAPWVAFFIVPVFGFANAGVDFAGASLGALTHMVPMGIMVGLVFGKALGVFLFSWLAIRAGLARRPDGASWGQLFGVAALCGIGFTMSLFIGQLAFADPHLQALTKMGVLLGSLASGLIGWAILRAQPMRPSPARRSMSAEPSPLPRHGPAGLRT